MKNKKFSIEFYKILFIVASLATFVLFCVIYFSLSQTPKVAKIENNENDDRYFLNENYSDQDTYITKEPDLSDMLTGPIISNSDPSTGDASAPVVIVLYSDYLCDFCREEEETIKLILVNYPHQIRLIWKDYPESDLNSLSWQAAAGARCADAQGEFIAYHDGLYGNKGFDFKFIVKLAENLGLNVNQFKACLTSESTQLLIYDNIDEANALAITGIPFIYVNDHEVMGQAGYEDLKQLVEIELKKANK